MLWQLQLVTFEHVMGIKEGGKLALVAGAGSMGIGAINYALSCQRKPSMIIVTDIDADRLQRVQSIFTPEKTEKIGIKLIYIKYRKYE